ncbi:MAG: recombination protein RecR [Saprospiraceae bacterium]|nr:recombination mediator RecR [Bacteroidia bacterium]MBT8229886.1 recombination mediator RecR [Bacteroidia bacterium]NNF21214.1 recombination protein RecR [Saprospiraceae bacterium]NNK89853.1 recombination protein RecR [Saprospiraceae bacterium]
MKYSSKTLERAVEALNSLPSIGKKSALRLVLHLAGNNGDKKKRIIEAIKSLSEDLKSCKVCNNYSDTEICNICADPVRNKRLICVVESVKDVMAIENTQQFNGVYHILGGIISPLEGIGPEDLHIDALLQRVSDEDVEELIMAITPSIEGDTTIYYLSKLLKESVRISTIARGVSFGGELEYADELTLGRSIHSRTDYNNQISV